MNAQRALPDETLIRPHFEMLHDLAAAAKAADKEADGVLVLASYGQDPVTGRKLAERCPKFAIGEVDNMVAEALAMVAEPHRNIYSPWAILRKGLPPGARGGLSDIVRVLALVIDGDADHGEKRLPEWPLPPPYVIQSSSGNQQPVYPFARALTVTEAQPIAEALAASIGGDGATKDVAHVWRVPGTLNWPNKAKLDRGRPPEPQLVGVAEPWTGELVGHEVLRAACVARGGVIKASQTQGGALIINTGVKVLEDRLESLRKARTDGKKHYGVRDITSSLASAGVPRDWIEAIARDACTVWDDNCSDLLNSAMREYYDQRRAKGAGGVREDWEDEAAAAGGTGASAGDDLDFAFWQVRDLTTIPRTQFVYSDFYARGYTSLTIAAPKLGKSMLQLAEAIDIASGLGFLASAPREPQRVLYFNAEDDQGVIDNRVAALLTHYNIPQEAIAGRLIAVSGVGRSDFFLATGVNGDINESLFTKLERFIADNQIDVALFDPLQDLTDSPETNEVFRRLIRRLRRTASSLSIAIGLVHHTRKVAPGMEITIDDARGGSALRGGARFSRILAGMTAGEARKAGVDNHRFYLRIGDVESNLAPPSAEVNRWFVKVNVEAPNGEHVGALAQWTWPDAFEGICREDAIRVQQAVAACPEPPRAHQLAKAWVGKIVAGVLKLDIEDEADKARVVAMVATWISADVLRVSEVHDSRTGRDVEIIVVGDNDLSNPMSEPFHSSTVLPQSHCGTVEAPQATTTTTLLLGEWGVCGGGADVRWRRLHVPQSSARWPRLHLRVNKAKPVLGRHEPQRYQPPHVGQPFGRGNPRED